MKKIYLAGPDVFLPNAIVAISEDLDTKDRNTWTLW